MGRFVFMSYLLAQVASCGDAPSIVVEPLQVISWVPNHGARCVAATQTDFLARITFSDDIEPESLTEETLFVRPENGTATPGTISYDKASQTSELRIQADLEHDTVHELVAKESIRGVDRGHLATELVSTFVTISPAGCF